MRLFVAVGIPDSVANTVAALPRPDRAGVRWTVPAQWHVTLRFIGEASPDEVIPAVAVALDGRDGPPVVPPVIASLGPEAAWFPGRRVLQVPVGGLDTLAGAVHRATRAWGEEGDRPFAGHLTLARTVGRRRGPAELAGASVSARFPVTEVGVYSSVTRPDGPVYQRLAAFPLGPAPDRGPAGSGSG